MEENGGRENISIYRGWNKDDWDTDLNATKVDNAMINVSCHISSHSVKLQDNVQQDNATKRNETKPAKLPRMPLNVH